MDASSASACFVAAANNSRYGARIRSGALPGMAHCLPWGPSCGPRQTSASALLMDQFYKYAPSTLNHKSVLQPILRDGHFVASSDEV